MSLPQGFGSQRKTRVCRLFKSLYGLKQARRQWNLKLTSTLVDSGFSQSKLDYSLFTKKSGRDIVIILVYVDDLLITGSDNDLIQDVKRILNVQNLSQFMNAPKQSHYEATLRVVKYVKNSPGKGLLMSSKQSGKVMAFCDVDWASCPVTTKSVIDYCIKLGDSMISWKSKSRVQFQEAQQKQNTRALWPQL
uniref:Uncharacterized mitochondrial protein AtMg00810-like n=1 Tax=Nicotiana tabacum TaxID=4097 RepID=A0A1S3X0Z5_TOBAC|nr:PREDICTED: uncharacterized mitochondrial protein AtMg00810-like [Nicotiana tabacum]